MLVPYKWCDNLKYPLLLGPPSVELSLIHQNLSISSRRKKDQVAKNSIFYPHKRFVALWRISERWSLKEDEFGNHNNEIDD